MTHLREQMYDAYSAVHVDLDQLARQAEVHGGRQRRRNRRRAGAASTLAVLAVVGLGTWATSNLAGGVADVGQASPAAPGSPELLTGVEALTATLSRLAPEGAVVDDVPTGMDYEPNRDGSPNAFGAVEFFPSAGDDPGALTVTYWPVAGQDVRRHTHCHDDLSDCEVMTLPDGSVVLTYVVDDSEARRAPGTLLAAHRVVNANVVTLAATSPDDAGTDSGVEDVVLTREQLVDVISQSEWSRLVPVPPSG